MMRGFAPRINRNLRPGQHDRDDHRALLNVAEDAVSTTAGLVKGTHLLFVSSTFRTAVANVEAGQVATADIDVAATPERLAAAPPPAEGSNQERVGQKPDTSRTA
jgi:hypothetical protein